MKELGGYIEFEHYCGVMLHENAIKLDCGRNALAYLIETKKIKRIYMPKFMCDACDDVLKKYGIEKKTYNIDLQFHPIDVKLRDEEWLYIVNFYGQLSDAYIAELKEKYVRIIADYTHAYFQLPVSNVDTLYTCRKYFGVPDGAILYTDQFIERELPQDISFDRMKHLLGRFEGNASDYYSDYTKGEEKFKNAPIKRMSKLTENLLHGIDYEECKNRRTNNFKYLEEHLHKINKLALTIPEGAFMYPLYIDNGEKIRKELQQRKIYIPCLWPNVVNDYGYGELENDMARNILPLPVDQRYLPEDMEYLVDIIEQLI